MITMNKPRESDPRVARTRVHVLSTAREMLGERHDGITFSTLAARAEVSRRTLYTHWGTIEGLLADTILPDQVGSASDYDGLNLSERLTLFYSRFSDAISKEVASGVAHLLWASQYDPTSMRTMARIGSAVQAIFVERVAPLTEDQYDLLIAPIIFARMTRASVSPTLISTLIQLGAQLLGAELPDDQLARG